MPETARYLLKRLLNEKKNHTPDGIYAALQIDMAYQSNRIEGSGLSKELVISMFQKHSISGNNIRVDDVIEALNHFRCLDFLLDHYAQPVTEKQVKHYHKLLKQGTFDADSPAAAVGQYKKYANMVGDMETVSPEKTAAEMQKLVAEYQALADPKLDDLLAFHAAFEKIHPFYDGNGRVGRLILFQQCLQTDVLPFIIENDYKEYYYRGLREWQMGGEKGYLRDTCLLMQDHAKALLSRYGIPYNMTN